jgi:hypothetical protein
VHVQPLVSASLTAQFGWDRCVPFRPVGPTEASARFVPPMRTFQGCNKTSLGSRYQLTTAGRLLENSNMKRKVISAADAAALVNDGDTLTTSGFVGIGVPDELLAASRFTILKC